MDSLKKIIKSIKSLKWYELVMCIIMIGISVYYALKPMEGCPQWLAIVNLISGVCGVICVFLTAKANRINFFFAVINTVTYMIYLYYFGIYATFWLEAIVYFPMNIISWIYWYKHKDEEDQLLVKTKKLSVLGHIISILCVVGLTILVHFTLQSIAGNSWMKIATVNKWNIEVMKWLDSSIFSIGIIGITLELLRYSEQYIWWLITDFISVVQYVLKKDPVYITKRLIYTIEAIIGIINWYKLSERNINNE